MENGTMDVLGEVSPINPVNIYNITRQAVSGCMVARNIPSKDFIPWPLANSLLL